MLMDSAGICSNTQETTSIGVIPQLSPPPSSTIWSPLFWIGVGVGVVLSALCFTVATKLKKYAMQQAFVDVSPEETVQKSPSESVKDDESSSVEEARVPEELTREVDPLCSNCNNMLNTQQSNERSNVQMMMMNNDPVFINQQGNVTEDAFNNKGNGSQNFTSAHINNKQSSPPAPAIDAVSTNPKQDHTSSKTGPSPSLHPEGTSMDDLLRSDMVSSSGSEGHEGLRTPRGKVQVNKDNTPAYQVVRMLNQTRFFNERGEVVKILVDIEYLKQRFSNLTINMKDIHDDLSKLLTDLIKKYLITQLDIKSKFSKLRRDMKTQFGNLRGDMETHFGNLRRDMENQFGKLEKDMETQFNKLEEDMKTHFNNFRDMETQAKNLEKEMETQYNNLKTNMGEDCDPVHKYVDNVVRNIYKLWEFFK